MQATDDAFVVTAIQAWSESMPLTATQQAAASRQEFLTKVEAAEHIRCSVRTLDRMKDLPRIKRGGRVLFSRASLDAAMLALESK